MQSIRKMNKLIQFFITPLVDSFNADNISRITVTHMNVAHLGVGDW